MFSLILYVFIQLAQSEEEQCKLTEAGGLVKFAHALAGPSRSIGDKISSSLFEDDEEKDDDEEGLTNLLKDAFGGVVYGGVFIIFTIILVFWTLCTQCCACYKCCRPANSGNPSICLIVFFTISAALMFFSMIVLYVSAANFTKTFKDVVGITSSFNSSYNHLVDKIVGAVYDIFDPINNTEKQIRQEMDGLMKYIKVNADRQKSNAGDAQAIITDYKNSFDISEGTTASNADYRGFKAAYTGSKNLDDYIQTPLERGPADTLIDIANKMVNSNSDLNGMVEKMSDNLNNGVFNDIESAIQGGYGQVDEVVGTLNSLQEPISDIAKITDKISEYEFFVSFFAYFIPTFVLLFLVGYVLSFIFKCCCSRCLLAWFHCIAFFVTIFVILFSGIFGILYGILDIYCPKLLDILVDDFGLGDQMDISSENFTQMFVCTEKKSLMDLGLDQVININKVSDKIDGVPDQLRDVIDFGNFDENINNKLDNFSQGLTFEDAISPESIIPGYKSSLNSIINEEPGQSGTINSIINLIEDKASKFPEAIDKLNECNQFSKEIVPRINSTINTTNNLILTATGTFSSIEDKIRDFNCIDTKCIYASLKNPFCGNIVAATGLWTIAATTTIMGLMLMSCAICKRRRQFKNVTVSPDDEYEGGDKELAGFSANDDLL